METQDASPPAPKPAEPSAGPPRRATSRRVRRVERLMSLSIRAGGIGTIAAVASIFFFLLWVAAPLFRGAEVGAQTSVDLGVPGQAPVALGLDPEATMAYWLDGGGTVHVVDLESSEPVAEFNAPDADQLSALGGDPYSGVFALAWSDGRIATVTLDFEVALLPEEDLPPALTDALGTEEPGTRVLDGVVYQRTEEGILRTLRPGFTAPEPEASGLAEPIRSIDRSKTPTGESIVVLGESGRVRVLRVRAKPNMFTGEIQRKISGHDLPFPEDVESAPIRVLINGLGTDVYTVYRNGRLDRTSISDPTQLVIADRINLLDAPEDAGTHLTHAGFLAGRTSVLASDSRGRMHVAFSAPDPDSEAPDGRSVQRLTPLDSGAGAGIVYAGAPRQRVLAMATPAGEIEMRYVPSGSEVGRFEAPGAGTIHALSIAPREDALVLWRGETLWRSELDLGHPSANWKSYVAPIQYEGYAEAHHVWQSSSASDNAEPKMGLLPLIVGTLKATLYSMLFGAPLALLAAIYSSEFLSRRWRTPVKSCLELMAGLPSVVLGFLAALVIAPFVQDVLPATLASFLAVPVCLLVGAHLWNLLPENKATRYQGMPRLLAMGVALPVGILLATGIGPLPGLGRAVESVAFQGDLRAWLDGNGPAWGGTWLLLLPLAALAVQIVDSIFVAPWIRRASATWDRRTSARASLIRFLVDAVAAVLLAFVVARSLGTTGFDPRGSVVGTYVQRNAMIVGLAMGFAIIPIIYTLAEDALQSVPNHLREASLGTGATVWQTTRRIVLPTAASGLFSALVIGLGRAVGETMIVLMAAGNTPIMDWNVFNGFRTLSANVAVELPEAVRNSTHYRTLFLTALILFAMTFLLNTVAELVRQRFRKRANPL